MSYIPCGWHEPSATQMKWLKEEQRRRNAEAAADFAREVEEADLA